MKQVRVEMLSVLMVLLCSLFGQAQQSVATAPNATVPPLIQFSNVATDEGGNALSGVVNITFSLYSSQQGGEPLWTETQNDIQLDATGHYSVQLGITKPAGVPASLFTTGEARWLGVQIAEQEQQPRVLLLSVPYALKAGDAATIGGLPASAFVLVAPPNGAAATYTTESATAQSVSPATATDVTTTGGTANYLPIFNGASTIVDSVLFQSATSPFKIGINTTTPASTLDVKGGGTIRGTLSLPATGKATATKGANSQPLNLAASAYNSSTPAAANQVFRWQAEPAGNDTATPSGTLNLLFGEGTAAPAETGLHIASTGQITFATGQTFPGTGTGDGTITGVTAGTDLTGGGTNGNVTLNLNTAATNALYARLGAANTFTANQTVNGTLEATSAGSGVIGNTSSSILAAVAGGGPQIGVYGAASSTSGSGVYGTETATTGTTAGVYGTSASPSGYGVEGASSSGGIGVYGISTGLGSGLVGIASDTAGGSGVVGKSAGGTGVYGSTAGSSGFEITQNIGVWGDTDGTPAGDYVAVLGSAGENPAAEFYNNGSSYITLYAENSAASQSSALVFETYGGHFGGSCDISVSGDLSCSGSLAGAVSVDSGARKVAVYAMQSSENWFEDAGSGQLSTGSARIALDPTFAQTVNTGVEYHVFLTPKGDCKGLYVTNETATGFEVHELSGGTSNIAFDYRIMAKRVGYENVRLADLTEQVNKREAQRQKMQHSERPSPAPQSGPKMATPPVLPARAALQPVAAQHK